MTKYDLIFEALEELIECGYLTIEKAELINERAYEMYNDEPVNEGTLTLTDLREASIRKAQNDQIQGMEKKKKQKEEEARKKWRQEQLEQLLGQQSTAQRAAIMKKLGARRQVAYA